jgi:hypothetical protein
LVSCSNRKVERCPYVHFSLGPDAPAVAVDDALDIGQTHAGTLVLDGPLVEWLAAQPRKSQQAIDQALHLVGVLTNDAQVALPSGGS